MEAVGVGIGLVSLASLFSTCIDCLEIFQRGLNLGKDFLLLETKFTNQCIRLRAWGRACQITEASRYESLVDDIAAQRQIEATLVQIHNILTSGIRLCNKYGPQPDRPTNTAMVMPSTLQTIVARSSNVATRFGQRLSEFKEKARLMQKNASYMNTILWAVDDRRKLLDLIQHLKDLIDDLQELVAMGKTEISKDFRVRQRNMIMAEVDTILDIPMLEAMVEAEHNEETVDDVSCVASVRIKQLQNQSSESLQRSQSEISRKTSTFSLQSLSSDWDCLGDSSPKSRSNQRKPCYQVLHEVHCAINQTSIFLEPPTYEEADGEFSQWTYLDTPTSNSRALHLCGNKLSADRLVYIAQNSHLSFIIFRHYVCDHDPTHRANTTPSHSYESILLISSSLCTNMDHLFSTSPHSCGNQRFFPYLELKSPFLRLGRSMRSVHAQVQSIEEDSQSNEETATFFQVVFDLVGEELDMAEILLRRRSISWRLLDFLFTQGGFVTVPQRYKDENYQAYEITRLERTSDEFELSVLSWAFDGNFEEVRSTFRISRSSFERGMDGLMSFDSLPCIPIEEVEGYELSKLEERGTTLWKCRHGMFQASITPDIGNLDRNEPKRYIIDAAEYAESQVLENPVHNKRLKDDLGHRNFISDQPPVGTFLSLLPPTVHGYDLQSREWQTLWVSHIVPIQWRGVNFETLNIGKDQKALLKAALNQTNRWTRGSNIQVDQLVKPKILLSGKDISAVATAADIFAEKAQLPLYKIRYRDVQRELQGRFAMLFQKKRSWRCVVHISADQLVEDKRGLDLEAEEATYEFIQKFEGILIFTTNWQWRIPPLVRSYFQLSISFSDMLAKDRMDLWLTLIGRRKHSPCAEKIILQIDHGQYLDSLAIHNVVTTAYELADSEGKRLDEHIMRRVLDNSEVTTYFESQNQNLDSLL